MTTMANKIKLNHNEKCFYVIHPLDDQAEEKRNTEGLGLMPLSPAVKYSLLSLRLYLFIMVGLVAYRAIHEIGLI